MLKNFTYLGVVLVLSILIVVGISATKNQGSSTGENIKGVNITKELLDFASKSDQQQDFEVFCDNEDNYVVTEIDLNVAELPENYQQRFQIVKGRVYIFDLNNAEVMQLRVNYARSHNTDINTLRSPENCIKP